MRLTVWLGAVLLLVGASVAEAQTVSVTGDRVNVRAEPNTSSAVVVTLTRGALVEVQDAVGDWYKIKAVGSGMEGFLHRTVVGPSDQKGAARPRTERPQLIEPPLPVAPAGERPAAATGTPRADPRAAARPSAARAADKGLFWVNGLYQTQANRFADTFAITRYLESGEVSVHYSTKSGPAFDVGGGVRVWRDLVVGAAVSRFARRAHASVAATVPHPFYFDTLRQVTGTSEALAHTEVGIHAFAMWRVPVGRRIRLGVFGGPSVLAVRQGVATDVTITETYPYDTATLGSVTTGNRSKSATGFNAGADVTYVVAGRLGVGGLVRYARGRVKLKTAGSASSSMDAGGLQAGVGVRFTF